MSHFDLQKNRVKILAGFTMALLGLLLISAKSTAFPQAPNKIVKTAVLEIESKAETNTISEIRAKLRALEQNEIRWSEVAETLEKNVAQFLNILDYSGPEKGKLILRVSTRPGSEDPYGDLEYGLAAMNSGFLREVSKGAEDSATVLLGTIEMALENRDEKGRSEEKIAASVLSEIETRDLKLAIPQTMEQEKLIQELERISKAAAVEISKINFALGRELNITLEMNAPPRNMIRFLKMIEVTPRKLIIKRAEIRHEETEGGLELLKANLQIKAFYQVGLNMVF